MWLIKDSAGRQLLLPKECVWEGNVLIYRDCRLKVSGDLQSLDPGVIEVIQISVPGSRWAGDVR